MPRSKAKPIIRSFEAFKKLPINNRQIAQLVANCKVLEGQELRTEINRFFTEMSANINSPAAYQALNEFLKSAGELLPEFGAQLEAINSDQNLSQADKEVGLKGLFVSSALTSYFAKYWKEQFSVAAEEAMLTRDQKVRRIFEEGGKQTASEYRRASEQGAYRLETQVVRNLWTLIFQIIDVCCVKSGLTQEPMFKSLYAAPEGSLPEERIPDPTRPGVWLPKPR
jgi:Asp-tRNA(Asn)/Glu-tRNA(Gln) amidotransferase A subunit family amidase